MEKTASAEFKGTAESFEKRKRLFDLVDKINSHLRSLVKEKKYREHDKYIQEIRNVIDKLKNRYGEDTFFQSELYHALAYSTMSLGTEKILDLPGGEWEEFIKKKAEDFGIE
jgi:hypothetical protein